MLTSRPALAFRSLLRSLGATRVYVKIKEYPLDLRNKRLLQEYRKNRPPAARAAVGQSSVELKVDDEQEFARAMTYRKDAHLIGSLLADLRDGDVFWDIGANFGLYGLLAAKVPGTKALLFDPDPWCVRRIRENVEINSLLNVEVIDVALSDRSGTMLFQPADHSVGGTSHLLDGANARSGTIEVPVTTGDQLRMDRKLPLPNAVKIDVEGFEWEVLQGLRQSIADPACRQVLVEVHFGLLAGRGMNSVPGEIGTFLGSAGFDRITWPDASHVLARKTKTKA